MTDQISPRTLIEAHLPFAGEVDLALIYATANELRIEDQPVRLALRRLISAGEVEQRGRGRAGVVELTESGRARLDIDRIAVRLAFAQDAGQAPWDGFWRLLGISAPESHRAIRDAFRRDVVSLGAAPFSTGLYVTPHDLTAFLPAGAGPYLVTAASGDLTMRGVTDPQEIVESLWPAQPTLAAYAELDRALVALPAGLSPVARQLRLADALELALRDDPLIPSELRPDPWRPAGTRRRWLDLWDAARGHDGAELIYRGWLPE